MKILVIDDSPIHQQSARQTLAGHDLTVVSSYDEAYELLSPKASAPFDAVLTDLLMPPGSRIQVDKQKDVPEMPVGFDLALQAAIHGARYAAVVSDGDHHHHPATAMLDRLGSYHAWDDDELLPPVRFEINGARVGFFRVSWLGGGMIEMQERVWGKDWGKILSHLLTAPVTPHHGY